MSRVVHFEITAQDPHRAVTFYRDVFGWKFTKWIGDANEDYWMIETGDGVGINGGLFKPSQSLSGHINTIDVPDIDEALAKVIEAGGEIVMDKHDVAGVGWHAYVRDTEGSVFGVMQSNR